MTSRWSSDELIVVLAFYFKSARFEQTDSHPECQKLAKAIGRSAGAVDQQIRNIDYELVRQAGDRHVGPTLSQLYEEYKDDIPNLYRTAKDVLDRNGWEYYYFD